jgi:hypothetical protein
MSKYGLEFYNKDNRKSFKIHLFKKHTVINIIEFNKINNINPTETVTTTKKKYEASELVTEAANAIEEIKAAPNYYFLSKILEKYGYFKKVPGEVSKTFVECYKKSGAYYTLAELITFNGCQFEKFRNPVEAMNYLKKELKKGTEAYKFHAMLKECIKQNNFNLNNIFDGWKM